jgi:cell wall-associated NlpC family hydrolase
MSAGIVRFRWRFATLVAALFAYAATVHAQEYTSPERGSFGVPLQPFSVRETVDAWPRAEPIRVAYYAPRSQSAPAPRTESVEAEDDLETTNAFPEINSKRPIVAGDRAILRNGIAYAPSRAPDNIKNAIWAVNTLRRKPYVWGGGHGSFNDYGYDCSGAVSFALHYAGLLDVPLPSNDFRRYGKRGRGRWITIYSRNGHTFAIIAGLRLDTTDMRDGDAVGPRWYADGRDTRGFEARHPPGW